MHFKRFEAPDSRTAMKMVKEQLGDDAVILSNKTVHRGTPYQRVEVVAAMDYDLESITLTKTHPVPSNGREPSLVPQAPATPLKRQASPPGKPGQKTPFDQVLKTQNSSMVSPENISQRPKRQHVARWRDQLISQLQTTELEFKASESPVIISLVGPTGMGKTTTAAKIAAWYSLRKNKRVALLSTDCYRIGATDQLRTYAQIMKLPCEIALRKKDLELAVRKHQSADMIIIDTAGKSPYDVNHINELQDLLSPVPDIKNHLVLSATTKKEDTKKIIETYTDLNISGLVLSKLDETRAYATLCQQVATAGIPVSFLATGQRVPEDFTVASTEHLENLFRKGWLAFNESRAVA
jgi:flagellar biosynthesis protein FlhF